MLLQTFQTEKLFFPESNVCELGIDDAISFSHANANANIVASIKSQMKISMTADIDASSFKESSQARNNSYDD